MTETQWLNRADGSTLIAHQLTLYYWRPSQLVERKLRLYFVALCRLAWNRFPAAGRAAIDFVERFADDPRPDPTTWEVVRSNTLRLRFAYSEPVLVGWCERDLRAVGLEVATGPPWHGSAEEWDQIARLAFAPFDISLPEIKEFNHPPNLVRCVFGNPFRLVAFEPQWQTRTVIDLARAVYEARDFAAMPVLADALEEAGCDDADVLTHCRGDAPYARGCWVVDHVLGK
jgi:hypothetical protein